MFSSFPSTRQCCFAALATLLLSTTASAADVLVGINVPRGQRVSFDQIDHSAWNTLLNQYVTAEGQVNYREWKASAEANGALDGYLATLSTGDPQAPSSKEAKIAFWSNAYNAVTIKGILREYPTTSIRNHTAKVWGYNIWKNLRLRVGDEPINLEDIEHKVLRKMGDPRVHFAIVCASIGCPRLLNEAYTAVQLEEQLDRNARHFFAQSQNFRKDPATNTIYLSAILNWFGGDFGADQGAQLRQFSVWLPDDASRAFVAQPGVKVLYQKYDWGLNGQ